MRVKAFGVFKDAARNAGVAISIMHLSRQCASCPLHCGRTKMLARQIYKGGAIYIYIGTRRCIYPRTGAPKLWLCILKFIYPCLHSHPCLHTGATRYLNIQFLGDAYA